MISRHPEPELLVEYSAGGLSTAPAISITTHLLFCEECRQLAESLEELGGELLSEADAIPVSEGLLDEVLACIDEATDEQVVTRLTKPLNAASIDGLPDYVQSLLPDDKLKWRFLSPSLRAAPISVGEDIHELALHRIKAGGKAPEHTHRGNEITVVLKGSFSDEDGVYHPGDFILREAGEVHRPCAARNDECICLSVLEAPIELTGIKRIFNPFLSFSPC
jgi:putative transcriptional regulator